MDNDLLCFGSRDDNFTRLYFGEVASSKILWKGSSPHELSYICFDLRASIPVKKISFSLPSKCLIEQPLVWELDGEIFGHSRTISDNCFEVEANGSKIRLGRFLSIRSVFGVDISPITNVKIESLAAIN